MGHTRETLFIGDRGPSGAGRIHRWLAHLFCPNLPIFVVAKEIVLFVFFGLETSVLGGVAGVL